MNCWMSEKGITPGSHGARVSKKESYSMSLPRSRAGASEYSVQPVNLPQVRDEPSPKHGGQ